MFFNWLDRYRDLGLLILRVGVGAAFMKFGWGKITADSTLWAQLGGAAGIPPSLHPAFWGFMAAFAEFGGGMLLILGLLFRPACLLMFINMMTALFAVHIRHGDGFDTFSPAFVDGVVFLSLLLIGPGRYSLDHFLTRKRQAPRGFDVVKTES